MFLYIVVFFVVVVVGGVLEIIFVDLVKCLCEFLKVYFDVN